MRVARPMIIAGCIFRSARCCCTGDLIIWAAPNAGNPQKAQRYAREWAEALRVMARLGRKYSCAGHGYPVFGAIRVRAVLNDTANYLQSLYDQTIALMNAGAPLDEVIHTVKPRRASRKSRGCRPFTTSPSLSAQHLAARRRMVRRHTVESEPATDTERAREIAALAAVVAPLIARANERLAAGDVVLACHLADWGRGGCTG